MSVLPTQMTVSTCCNIFCHIVNIRVPTLSGKPGKIGKVFPVREISGNLKILQNIREKLFKNYFFIFLFCIGLCPFKCTFGRHFGFFYLG